MNAITMKDIKTAHLTLAVSYGHYAKGVHPALGLTKQFATLAVHHAGAYRELTTAAAEGLLAYADDVTIVANVPGPNTVIAPQIAGSI